MSDIVEYMDNAKIDRQRALNKAVMECMAQLREKTQSNNTNDQSPNDSVMCKIPFGVSFEKWKKNLHLKHQSLEIWRQHTTSESVYVRIKDL